MADTFEHAPQVWTAGRLRSALTGVTDDTPIHIGVADEPGNLDGYGEFVLVNAEPVEIASDDSTAAPQVQFTLFADAKAGVYYLHLD
ncbi:MULTISPECIES: DUF6225 family protein [unclassified Streptomyces]|uniref:DUF6225 family protein n=1 Tax=unclassified Streptomyces TaxID=2593676 RepID=UPI001BE81266|nr:MULTISPECIES: DUF6225 family protein [unclassified Streptomyces]MBT2408936.1 hypothetical protein [Streptomyces sp. ISL-21]MBT2613522.1 hypothetical protein [Streptomyces sp. ISL-87]